MVTVVAGAGTDARIDEVDASAFVVPTDALEADGTLSWDSTTLVLVQVQGGGLCGTGWTYGPAACAGLVADELAEPILGRPVLDVGGTFATMVRQVRNAGRPGAVGYALSAIDLALWNLKARLLDLPLHRLLGAVRPEVPVYGRPRRDLVWIEQARELVGDGTETSTGCARPRRWTAYRPMPPAAGASLSGREWPPWPPLTTSRSPGTAPRTCTRTRPPRRPTCGTWSGSTTTPGLRPCFLTARSIRLAARFGLAQASRATVCGCAPTWPSATEAAPVLRRVRAGSKGGRR